MGEEEQMAVADAIFPWPCGRFRTWAAVEDQVGELGPAVMYALQRYTLPPLTARSYFTL